jgi:hypothetical protein
VESSLLVYRKAVRVHSFNTHIEKNGEGEFFSVDWAIERVCAFVALCCACDRELLEAADMSCAGR